jgi:hypothetical protein
MMGTKLVYQLIEDRWFPALGTVEMSPVALSVIRNGGTPYLVEKGTPLTYDSNNGTLVVYDDAGHPWIKSSRLITPRAMANMAVEYGLQPGARVPHSNDGGTFKRLLAEQTGEHI